MISALPQPAAFARSADPRQGRYVPDGIPVGIFFACRAAAATHRRGLVLEEGGPNSHVAIVARALGIAAHDRIVDDDHPLAGDHGAERVQLQPDAELTELMAQRQCHYKKRKETSDDKAHHRDP